MIRKLELSEYQKVETLFQEEFESLTFNSMNPFEKIYVYEDNLIKGFISYSVIYERCELNYLAVLKPFQNQKIGTKLLQFMIEKEKDKEISLEVRQDNKKAISLYQKWGFKIVGSRKNYYHEKDAYLMILSR